MSIYTPYMSTETGVVLDMPEDEYHAHPALSQSQLKTLLDCPARFAYEREHGRPHKAAYDTGHAVHTPLLGVGGQTVVVDADDWRTKAAREARDAAHADGKVPLLRTEAQRITAIRDAVMAHPAAQVILDAPGSVETSMFWTDPGTGLNLRGRIDKVALLGDGQTHALVDLKSASSAAPHRFARSVWDFRYHLQRAAYTSGWELLTGEACEFIFVVVETAPPHLTAVYTLDDIARAAGERDYRDALDLYLTCTEADHWPGYADDITTLPSPRWAS